MAEIPPSSGAGPSRFHGSFENHPQNQFTTQPYFNQPGNFQYSWQNSWPADSFYQAPHAHAAQQYPKKYLERETQTSPPPDQEYHLEWDLVIKNFLSSAGFTQALRGFEADMLVFNSEWERKHVPNALSELLKALLSLGRRAEDRDLEDRKLGYVHLREGVQLQSQKSITKDISIFLAKNRARNDRSNRNEFLHSLAQKRRRLTDSTSELTSSCARADAKSVDRDLQIKYDIAKNEEGPLRNTVRLEDVTFRSDPNVQRDEDGLLSAQHPGLNGRVTDLETHLSIKYVPSPPRLILDRIKFLENRIVGLEQDYPPWAALHFNQPNRGWPPPPRPTPVIVPARMMTTPTAGRDVSPSVEADKGKSRASSSKRGRGSSLHKAVMERLEVKKAKDDLARGFVMEVDQE